MSGTELVVIDSTGQPAASCAVCGKEVVAGGGLTATFRGETLRFRCPGCLSRFAADPDRFLREGPSAGCEGHGHDHHHHEPA